MWKTVLAVAVLGIVSYRAFNLALMLGAFENTYNHAPGKCRTLKEIDFGSEDIEVLPNGQAFISSGVVFFNHSKPGAFGRFFLFDFNKPKNKAIELKIIAEGRYRINNPHGISVWTDPKNGNVYLYAINHLLEGEAVDKYLFDNTTKTLTHLKRFENIANFQIINDVAVVGEDQFYVTNFLYVNEMLEVLLNLHWGSVAFFDGQKATIVDTGLLLPNGLIASDRYLYVAHPGNQEVRVYEIKKDKSLTFVKSVKLGANMDNLSIDPDTGDVWVTADPHLYKIFAYLEHPGEALSTSHVLRVRVSTDEDHPDDVTEIYSNDGSEISGASIAVRYKDAFLIGSILTNTLYCEYTS